jgi:hypothetical protein
MQSEAHNRDANQEAARIVRGTTGQDDQLPPDLEAAWAEWSKRIKNVDERGLSLLRAAFEAGADAARGSSAAKLGRKGGLKGGKARAEKLTAKERSEIAKKAARARWPK